MLNLAKLRSLLDARQPKHTLPQAFYTDPEVYEFDLAAIYATSWILVGFEVELPNPGSYLSLPIGRSSVLIVRDREGTLRGFHNACRHRGAQLRGGSRSTLLDHLPVSSMVVRPGGEPGQRAAHAGDVRPRFITTSKPSIRDC